MAAVVCAQLNGGLDSSRLFKKPRYSTVNPPPTAASFAAPPVSRRKRSYVVIVEKEDDFSLSDNPVKKLCFRDEDYAFSSTAENGFCADNDPIPSDKVEWVDLMIKEMMSATDVDDAKSRASRLLDDLLAKFAVPAAPAAANDHAESDKGFQEKIQTMSRENSVLKQAVAILYERLKEYEEGGEVKQLKELLKKYQEQVRNLEVSNYGLTMHLQQALQATAVGGFGRNVY